MAEKKDKRVKVVVGEPLKQDILSMDQSLVLCKKGTLITHDLIGRLSNWIVEDEPRISGERQKPKARKKEDPRRDILKRLEFEQIVSKKTRENLEKGCDNVFKKLSAKKDEKVDISELEESIAALVEETPDNPDVPLKLFELKKHSSFVFQHSVECSVVASYIATTMNYPQKEVSDFTMAMMLHDIGMLTVEPNIISKPSSLDAEEWKQIREHTTRGFNMLKSVPGMDPLALLMASGHHVMADGSGYPANEDVNELAPFVRLGVVVNMFEALTADRPWRKGRSLAEAVKIILSQRDRFHPAALENFVRVVGIYPITTFAALNTGEVGVVVRNNPENLFLPEIKLVLDPTGKKYSKEIIVNLLNEPVRRIVKVRDNI